MLQRHRQRPSARRARDERRARAADDASRAGRFPPNARGVSPELPPKRGKRLQMDVRRCPAVTGIRARKSLLWPGMSGAVRAEFAMVGIGSTHHFTLQNNHFQIGLPPNFPRSVSQHPDDFPLTRRGLCARHGPTRARGARRAATHGHPLCHAFPAAVARRARRSRPACSAGSRAYVPEESNASPPRTFTPRERPGSPSIAASTPRSASRRMYGSVTLVSAFVEVTGTAPGILATQ